MSKGDDAWPASWESINALAWWSLNRSAALNPPVAALEHLRLWDDAMGFCCEHPPMTLTVFEPSSGDGGDPVVRKASWQRRADLDRLYKAVRQTGQVMTPRPTIDVQDAPMPLSRYAELLEEAAALHVPIVWFKDMRSLMLDVGSVGLEFISHDRPPAVLRLEWSVEIPPEWEPVVAWVTKVREFLEGCLAIKGARPPRTQADASHPLWDREIDAGTA